MASTQTILRGAGNFTAAGAFNAPAPGRGDDVWGAHHINIFTLQAVTTDANGVINFDPRALGVVGTPSAVFGFYMQSASTDHAYVITGYDPVNHNLTVRDLTDSDNPTEAIAGQFIVFVISE
jgi:hypothetical protein